MTEYITISNVTFPIEFDGEFYRIACGGCHEDFATYLLADMERAMIAHKC